jgi:hypothetical protein
VTCSRDEGKFPPCMWVSCPGNPTDSFHHHKEQLGETAAALHPRSTRQWLRSSAYAEKTIATLTLRTADIRGLTEMRCPKGALMSDTAPLRNLFQSFIDYQLHDFLVS